MMSVEQLNKSNADHTNVILVVTQLVSKYQPITWNSQAQISKVFVFFTLSVT
jgi:hypothetical protein